MFPDASGDPKPGVKRSLLNLKYLRDTVISYFQGWKKLKAPHISKDFHVCRVRLVLKPVAAINTRVKTSHEH